MLKVFGNEAVKQYYLAQRVLYLLTRSKSTPKAEPSGPAVSAGSYRKILTNDVSAY